MQDTAPPVVEVVDDVVLLHYRGKEIRFPTPWGKKFAPWWRDGRSRNVVCNADVRRFNLLGVTRRTGGAVWTYLEGGEPKAVTMSSAHLALLASALEAEIRP